MLSEWCKDITQKIEVKFKNLVTRINTKVSFSLEWRGLKRIRLQFVKHYKWVLESFS